MRITSLATLLLFSIVCVYSQSANPANDPEAAELLRRISAKYQSYNNISADFRLLVVRPKLKPEDNDSKNTDTLSGKLTMQQNKFRIDMKGQEIICAGTNIWTYLRNDKEVQVNYFEESDDMLSPSKIFTLYKDGFLYGIKEKKTIGGKSVTVVEMSPSGRKASYFKIDLTIDPAAEQLLESKIYEKNGIRYIYKLSRQTPNANISSDIFSFDSSRYSGVKVVDLR